MLKLNGTPVTLGSFPDGTLLLREAVPKDFTAQRSAQIDWYYAEERELPALIYLTEHLHAHGVEQVHLFLPYIPNARQDRVKTDEDVFTLRYFAKLINSLGFQSVTVLDPHSSVSEALLERLIIRTPAQFAQRVIAEITAQEGEAPLLFYPDEGAGKRYGGMIGLPYAFGIKKRDWKTGKIQGLDAAGETERIVGSNVLIVDDICSRGGTFFHAARALRERGAKHIYLFITHCENTILTGELTSCGLLQRIYTTNSIFTGEHSLITVFDCQA